jgi:hypothetical protein
MYGHVWENESGRSSQLLAFWKNWRQGEGEGSDKVGRENRRRIGQARCSRPRDDATKRWYQQLTDVRKGMNVRYVHLSSHSSDKDGVKEVHKLAR